MAAWSGVKAAGKDSRTQRKALRKKNQQKLVMEEVLWLGEAVDNDS